MSKGNHDSENVDLHRRVDQKAVESSHAEIDSSLLETELEQSSVGSDPQVGTPTETEARSHLLDRYRMAGLLGKGGMALVHEAFDTALERPVAIKVIREQLAQDCSGVDRFMQEAVLMGQMEHPGIIPVYDRGTLLEGLPFYAMKRIHGKTLAELLAARGPQEIRSREALARFVEAFEKISQTVAYAHAHRVIHRDLKPSNVMVDDYGVVLVMDWGLAKRLGDDEEDREYSATQTGVVQGTPSHMSPEQARGETRKIDFRTDVFSLGVILYEILTGMLPFSASSLTELLSQVKDEDPTPPRGINPKAPRALEAICLKAMSKDPNERYATAQDLAEDVGRFRKSLPTKAYTPTLPERLANWAVRKPSAATAVSAIAILAMFAGGLALGRMIVTERLNRDDVHAAMDFMDQMAAEVEHVDEAILALANNDRLTANQRELLQEELLALRDSYTLAAVRAQTGTSGLVLDSRARELNEFVEQLSQKGRQFYMEDIERLYRIGELGRAMFLTTQAILNTDAYHWSAEDQRRLLELRDSIERDWHEIDPDSQPLYWKSEFGAGQFHTFVQSLLPGANPPQH